MLRKARELLAAFLALWVATDPSPENRADERLVALPRNDVHSRKADPVLWHEIASGSRRVVRASIPFGAGFVDFYGHDEAELAEMVAGFDGTEWDNDITAEGV